MHTVNELLNAAAEALANQDIDTIERLMGISVDWLQTEDERQAQLAALTAMRDAIDEIGSLENELNALQGA